MTKYSGFAALALSVLLASCQTYEASTGPDIVSPKLNGIDGEWVGTDGVAVSSFTGGAFTSKATDTGQLLAQGNYTYRDQQNIDISFRSLIRNTSVNAACIVVMPSQMNCTSSSGAKFTLVRKASAPGAASAALAAPKPVVQG
jgi:hypothetical protein